MKSMKKLRALKTRIKPKMKKALIIGAKESKILAKEIIEVLKRELPKIKKEINRNLNKKRSKKKRR